MLKIASKSIYILYIGKRFLSNSIVCIEVNSILLLNDPIKCKVQTFGWAFEPGLYHGPKILFMNHKTL